MASEKKTEKKLKRAVICRPKLPFIPQIPRKTKLAGHSDGLSDTISLRDISPFFPDLLTETRRSSDQSSLIISSALLDWSLVYCTRSPDTNDAPLVSWSTRRNEPAS